jgi:acyl carrier protein
MSIELRVRQIVAKVLNLPADNIRLKASLKDDLGATSLDRYTVLMDVEEAFSLDLDDVPEDELDTGIQTVGDIVKFLNKQGCTDGEAS